MALIFFASSVPGDELPGHFWDKAVHFSVYAVLGVLFLIPLADARLLQVTVGKAGMAVLLSTLYGAFDEMHQAFTPDRTPDVRDLFADAFGAALGVLVVLLVKMIVKKSRWFEGPDLRRGRR
jgi:VanZ family protein